MKYKICFAIAIIFFFFSCSDEENINDYIGASNFVLVEGGEFLMGDYTGDTSISPSALPVHKVTLDDFYISRYEITNKEYCIMLNEAFSDSLINNSGYFIAGEPKKLIDFADMDTRICFDDIFKTYYVIEGFEDMPVTEVTWFGSVFYCNYLSIHDNLDYVYDLSNWSCDWQANGYRLPTEAEWEYAARGGVNWADSLLYSGCNTALELIDYSWFNYNSEGVYHEVGTKLPNQLGIYDMTGNVREWCWDWESDYAAEDQTNPTGPLEPQLYNKISRGGDYLGSTQVHARNTRNPDWSDINFGFRVARNH
jgi:formylglycine-generating enzyme required for sulfatase activity